jgi:hypothetical protein
VPLAARGGDVLAAKLRGQQRGQFDLGMAETP